MSYYIAPTFLKVVALHLTKNHLPLSDVPVPLILGIHGRKGEGKTFQPFSQGLHPAGGGRSGEKTAAGRDHYPTSMRGSQPNLEGGTPRRQSQMAQ